MSAPLVVNTAAGVCWTRRVVTSGGIALYAPEAVRTCPEFVMATLAELAEQGIVGSADVLPVPVGPEPGVRGVLDRARDALGARMTKDALSLVLENTVAYAARLEARVTELEAERHETNEALDDAVQALRARESREVFAERARTGTSGERTVYRMLAEDVADGEHYPAVHHDYRESRDLPETPVQQAAVCRCDEPDADPYACEAEPEDCTGEFSELSPFGGGPVEGHDAKVSRTCDVCGWRTSVWHVGDGSAEEELHGHVSRVHGGQTGGA